VTSRRGFLREEIRLRLFHVCPKISHCSSFQTQVSDRGLKFRQEEERAQRT
jgi:hypothetical protein